MNRERFKEIAKLKKNRLQAQKNGKTKIEAEIVNALGDLYTKIGDFDEALLMHQEELILCKTDKDLIGQGIANRKIGEALLNQEKFEKALKYHFSYLELAKLSHDLVEEQRALATLGRTYLIKAETNGLSISQDVLKKSVDIFNKSLTITKRISNLTPKEINEMKVRCYLNLGLCSKYLSEYDLEKNLYEKNSKEYFHKAIHLAQSNAFYGEIYRAYTLLTLLHRQKGELKLARRTCESVCCCAKKSKNKEWIVESYEAAGEIYLCLGEIENAKSAFKKCYKNCCSPENKEIYAVKLKQALTICNLEKSLSTNDVQYKYDVHEAIGDLYSQNDSFVKALHHYKSQESLMLQLPKLTSSKKAAVYYSIALTYCDMKDYDFALVYFKKELDLRTDNKERCQTWTQIGKCKENNGSSVQDIISSYENALECAKKSEDLKLQFKVYDLLKKIFVTHNITEEICKVNEKLLSIEDALGLESSEILSSLGENSEDFNAAQNNFCAMDSEDLLKQELDIFSDDSDAEEYGAKNRQRMNQNWKKKINKKGETALHRACIDNKLMTVQLLLKQGHPLNVHDNCGWTPLHEACNHGHTEIVQELLEHGVNINPNVEQCDFITPLHDAAMLGHFDIALMLLENGGKLDVRDIKGLTPLDIIEKSYHDFKEDMGFEMQDYYHKIKLFIKRNPKEAESKKLSSNLSCKQTDTPTAKHGTQYSAMVYSDSDGDEFPDLVVLDPEEYISEPAQVEPHMDDNAIDEYRDALASIGSSNTVSKLKKHRSGINKRSLGATSSQSCRQKSWLEVEDKLKINKDDENPSKRFRANTKAFKQAKLPVTQSLSRTKSRTNRPQKQSYKKLVTTKIHQFMIPSPECSPKHETSEYEDEIITISTNDTSSIPESSKTNCNTATEELPTKRFCVKVNINDNRMLLAVPNAEMKTIAWLCERVCVRYKQSYGIKPKLKLFTTNSTGEEPMCLLLNDDIITDSLQNNDTVFAKVESWDILPLPEQYKEMCKETKAMIIAPLMQACNQCCKTGFIDIHNNYLSYKRHLQPLLKSLGTSDMSLINLSGNRVTNEGVAVLCQSLKNCSVFATNQVQLHTINLSATHVTSIGLNAIAEAAEQNIIPHIRCLDLSYNDLTDTAVCDVTKTIKYLKNLSQLRLSRCGFTVKSLRNYEDLLPSALNSCEHLQSLDISENSFGTHGIKVLLEALKTLPTKLLNVSGTCNYSNNCNLLDAIEDYLKFENLSLVELHISTNDLSHESIEMFFKSLTNLNLNLRHLNLSKNNINKLKTDSLISTAWKELPYLEKLSVLSVKHKWITKNT